MDLADLGTMAAGLGTGGLSVGTIAWFLLRNLVAGLQTQVREQQREITALKNNELSGIVKRLDKLDEFTLSHDRNCPTAVMNREMAKITSDLGNAIGWLKRIDGKMNIYTDHTTRQDAEIKGLANWMKNLDNSHRDHTRDRGVHSNG